MDCLTVSFIAAAAEDAWSSRKASTTGMSAPSIHCMDSSLLELTEVQQDQQQQRYLQHQDASMQLRVRTTPSPPPVSIFIPPSAVPACTCVAPGTAAFLVTFGTASGWACMDRLCCCYLVLSNPMSNSSPEDFPGVHKRLSVSCAEARPALQPLHGAADTT